MKYVIANWKMNLSLSTSQELLSGILDFLKNQDHKIQLAQHCMIAPSYPFLSPLKDLIEKKGHFLSLVAQDISASEKGAFTGDISASQLQEIGVYATLLGHSERRNYHHETEELLSQKIQRALAANLKPIICIGESLETRENHKAIPFILEQLKTLCFAVQSYSAPSALSSPPFLIAYEPLWAIGTGITPTSSEIEEIHLALHHTLDSLFPRYHIPVIYGGSVTPYNIHEILSLPSVNGVLVGGASLSLSSFIDILTEALSQKH